MFHRCTRADEILAAADATKEVPTPGIPGALHVPKELFEEIEPFVRPDDGKIIRRFRLKGTDKVLMQDPMDRCAQVEVTAVGPMELPKDFRKMFYTDYKYGDTPKKEPESK